MFTKLAPLWQTSLDGMEIVGTIQQGKSDTNFCFKHLHPLRLPHTRAKISIHVPEGGGG